MSGFTNIGNSIEDIYENPLALTYGKEDLLNLLLPLANHNSKLTALLRLITELYFANQHIDSMSDWIASLKQCIYTVLNSLTTEEARLISTQKNRVLLIQNAKIQALFFKELNIHQYNKALADQNQSLVYHITLAFGAMRLTQHIETQTDPSTDIESNEFIMSVCDTLLNQLETRKRAAQWRLNNGQWFQNSEKCREKIAAIETISDVWQQEHDIKKLSKLLRENATILTQTTSTLPSFFQREVSTKVVLSHYSSCAFLS